MEYVAAQAQEFVRQWALVTQARDVEKSADLFLRDPAPLVTFSDGERTRDWLDVRVRLERDFTRNVIERVDVHHIDTVPLAEDVVAVSFVYELHARDLWGMPVVATRLASMTLTLTKDGYRIATAHFSAPPAPR